MIDTTKLLATRQDCRVRFCVMPPFKPSVSLLHDGDAGAGHAPIFYDIPILGPNRIGMVGEPVDFYGGESYSRGGLLATGHTWNVYLINPADPEGVDRTLAGTLVAGPIAAQNLTWVPLAAGTYRVELALLNRHVTFNSDGFRLVRIFEDDLASDLEEAIEFSGSGGLAQGGHTATITYRPAPTSQVVEPWSRIVVNIDTYYDETLSTFDSGGPQRTPSVQFNGLVVADSISVNRATETVTFSLATPDYALRNVPIRGYERTESQAIGEPPVTVSVPVEYPLFFADPNAVITLPDGTTINPVQYVQQAKADFPIHQVAGANFLADPTSGMTITDPIYHALQMHLNFMKWWDVYLLQETAAFVMPVSFPTSDFWSAMKSTQEKRLGDLFADRKGALHFALDERFQDEAVWLAGVTGWVMTFTPELIDQIDIQETHFRVCQVRLTGVDGKYIPYFVRYPAAADFIGQPFEQTSMLVPDKTTLETWARRLYIVLNQPFTASVVPHGINRSLDIDDLVGLVYADPAGKASL